MNSIEILGIAVQEYAAIASAKTMGPADIINNAE
jgi:hypothetical protein